ncbi:FAD-binding protein [Synechococcus sp. NOUM97013]|uniref:FAD-binding protein n=1 Tax=Synechococcus sp. NOUM97013 TaxID=1442555 RepID=UPI0016488905|nr:FAD-binding protein [Synechococcus sp. NOUM97013]QNI73714.1 FAD domain-containing protein [Synechococcus sp. NOUM97013]
MNTQARDAKSLGSLCPGPELLPELMRQPLGGTPLQVRSGGTSSRCAADQHWTLDLRRHQQFRYLSATQEVEFGTGLSMADLLRQLQAFNRAIPIGLSGLPGSGFVLTGGMGPLSRTQGLAIDHITQIEGVWGSGAPFTLDVEQARHDPTLAAECRGLLGAAPFLAVVTKLRLRTHPIVKLRLRRGWINPSELPAVIALAEQWPESCSLQWTWGERLEIYAVDCSPLSAPSAGLHALDPFLNAGSGGQVEQVHDQLDLPAFGQFGMETPRTASAPSNNLLHSEVLGRLGPAFADQAASVIEQLQRQMRQRPHPACRISAQQLGGATARIDPSFTAFVHRDAQWKPWITAAWTPGDLEGRLRSLAWMEGVSDDLRTCCPGVHLAQLHDHLPNHQQELRDAFGSWLPELQHLKANVDPDAKLPPL